MDTTSTKKLRLGEYLISHGMVKPEAVEAALAEQKITQERLGLILTRSGFLTRKNLLKAILDTNPDRVHGEQHFTSRVPAELLLELQTIIVAETDEDLYLATLRDEGTSFHALKEYYPQHTITFVAANHEQIDSYLDNLMSMMQDEDSIVEKLIRRALTENVSDIHIIPRYNSYSVFYRHLGVRKHTHEGNMEEYNTLSARIKDLSRMDLAERRMPQDGAFSMDHDGKIIDLRVATVPTVNGEYVVIRILDPDRVQPSLEGLGISAVENWRKGVSRPDGLCLICGPTGSGKTTTLNASIKEMDRFGSSIYTLEDPVEYRISYTGQVNINHAVGLDFSRGIKAFMRSDPDVILVGEIRDPDTARNAIKAAETGHLVVGTLHTGSILGAVSRLRDLDVPAHELRYLLRSVLVQRLIRTYCPECGGEGCKNCFGTGYAGRTIVSECAYFAGEKEVESLLDGNRSWETMLEDAVNKHFEGVTSAKEVIRVFGIEAEREIAARLSGGQVASPAKMHDHVLKAKAEQGRDDLELPDDEGGV